jgi:PAS domain S-box-containing protein
VDALPDLIFMVDRNHRITRVNKAMRDRLGMSYDEIVGQPCFFCVQGHLASAGTCPHDLLLADRRRRTVAMEEQQLGGCFELTVVPYYSAGGELAGSIHIARDVSAQRQAQRDQEKLQARLLHSAKLESVGQLAAGIAHEINTPAQFITANIDFLDESFAKVGDLCTAVLSMVPAIRQNAVTTDQCETIEAMVDELDWDYLKEELPLAIAQSKEGLQRVTSIVQAIKEFSHPGSKQKTAANLNRIIETTITVARNEWKYVATVVTRLDPDLGAVPCHADEIGQVILNILINAAHALESMRGEYPEGRQGQITITSAQDEQYAEIRIADNGPGIPESIRHKVFDPFFTTKQVGKGTGQGLAIAHDVIATKHDGTLSFETSAATGTTFIIRLPRRAGEPIAHIE